MLTQIRTQEDLTYLQKRFFCFNDSVLESWAVDWTDSPKSGVKAQLRVQDYGEDLAGAAGVWSQVVLRMEGCESFRIVDSHEEYYRVTANGINILISEFEEKNIGVDFGYFTYCPDSIVELRKSPCCVICSRLFWEIL